MEWLVEASEEVLPAMPTAGIELKRLRVLMEGVLCVFFLKVIKANNNTVKLVLVLYIMFFLLVVFLLLLINCCLAVSPIHQPDFTQKLIIYKLLQIRSQWPNASFPLSQSLDANEVVQLVNITRIEVLDSKHLPLWLSQPSLQGGKKTETKKSRDPDVEAWNFDVTSG